MMSRKLSTPKDKDPNGIPKDLTESNFLFQDMDFFKIQHFFFN
jgi:hypothetical protein